MEIDSAIFQENFGKGGVSKVAMERFWKRRSLKYPEMDIT